MDYRHSMSRAFVRESDDAGDELKPMHPPLPPGVTNYITPAGAKQMQAELGEFLETRRSSGEQLSSQERRRLDSQIRQLQQRLQTLVITTPPPNGEGTVCFGATVRVRDSHGEENTYQIVGIDETDLDRDLISWRSPLAKALLSHRTGEKVQFDAPSGRQDLEIVEVTYPVV